MSSTTIDPTVEENEKQNTAIRYLARTNPDETIASLLQETISGMDTPLVFFRETNGYDLHVLQWRENPTDQQLFHVDFTHLQYQETPDNGPTITVIAHTENSENIRLLHPDATSMMDTSRSLMEQYQTLRYSDPTLSQPTITYMQEEILAAGDTPSLMIHGSTQPARDWTTLVRQTVLELKLEEPTKGKIMEANTEPQTPQPSEKWAHVNIPNAFVHPYVMTAKDGKQWDKMIITLPKGTTLNGIDVSGWALDKFMSDESRNDKANGKPVTLAFKPGDEIELFKGKGENRKTLHVDNPWTLATAIKEARETYAQKKEEKQEINTKKIGTQHDVELNDGAKAHPNPQGDAWQVGYGDEYLGDIRKNSDGTYQAITPQNINGTAAPSMATAGQIIVDEAKEAGLKMQNPTRQPVKRSMVDEMTGRTFNVEYRNAHDEVHYAQAVSNGIGQWTIQANDQTLGKIQGNPDGTVTAYPVGQADGTLVDDPISATRVVLRDSGIAMAVGEIRTTNIPQATIPTEQKTEKKDKKTFLEKMNDATRKLFPDKKFGDNVTPELNHMNQQTHHNR